MKRIRLNGFKKRKNISERIEEENIRRRETKESMAHWEVVKEFEILWNKKQRLRGHVEGAKKSGRKIDTGCTSTWEFFVNRI